MYQKIKLLYAGQPDTLERKIEEFINSEDPPVRVARDSNRIRISTFARESALYDSKYAAVIEYPDIM